MKNGTLYARKLKKTYVKLRQNAPRPMIPASDDPLRRLAVAILGVGCTDHKAQRALDRALTVMVDWNDMRVSSAFELNKATGNTIPLGMQRCRLLIDALQAVFDRENRLSLDRLRNLGRREARQYLEALDGVDEYAVASIVLWGLGGHAIPVNDKLLAALRQADLVNPSADRGEVQAFLERHVGAADAKEFCTVMQWFAETKPSVSKRARTASAAGKKAARSASRSK